jgi:signal transduction histidine kinase
MPSPPRLVVAGVALTALVRVGFTSLHLYEVLSFLPWQAVYVIGLLSSPANAWGVVIVFFALFPAVRRWPLLPFLAVAGSYSLLTILDYELGSMLLPWWGGAALGGFLYLLVRGLVVRRRTLPQNLYVVGLAFAVIGSVNEMLTSFRVIHGSVGFHSDLGLVMLVAALLVASLCVTAGQLTRAAAGREAALAEKRTASRLRDQQLQFNRLVNHELHTPLAAIVGFAELTAEDLRGGGDATEAAKGLEAIAAEGMRLAALAENLVRVTGPSRSDEVARLDAVMERLDGILVPYLDRTGITLELDWEPGLSVRIDEAALIQLAFNLVSNASRHCPGGRIRLTATRCGGMAVFACEDDGAGVAPELLPHVFEAGVSGDGRGRGLGLALSRAIVGDRGGELAISSTPGQGTVVTFTLPIASAAEPKPAPRPRPARTSAEDGLR